MLSSDDGQVAKLGQASEMQASTNIDGACEWKLVVVVEGYGRHEKIEEDLVWPLAR